MESSSEDEGSVWNDDEIAEIVGGFPFDKEEILTYYLGVKKIGLGILLGVVTGVVLLFWYLLPSFLAVLSGTGDTDAELPVPTLMLALICGAYCAWKIIDYLVWAKPNLRDQINAQHCAVTRENVMYVKDRHLTSCRFECNWEGKFRKTIPLEKITDVEIREPAGRIMCGLMEEKLVTVNIQTASTAGCELSLQGLADPHGFRKLVFDLKRGGAARPAATAGGAPMQQLIQPLLTNGGDSREVVVEMQQMNKTLKSIEKILANQERK